MKRFLAAFLCILCCLGLLPDAVYQASAVTKITWISPKSSFFGEPLTWGVNAADGLGPFQYRFLLYRNDQLIESTEFSEENSKTFLVDSLGDYSCVIVVNDIGFGNTVEFESTPVSVTNWPSRLITKVEAVNATALKITWTPVKGAQRYEVYRAQNKAGPYKLVKAMTAACLTNTYLSAGTQYYYKVRFLSAQGSWSPLSTYVTGVPVAKAVITSITAPSARRIRLAWAKAAGASGYQVLLSSSPAGPYRVVRTLPGTTVTFSGLKKRSRLYFQVRPYRKIYSTVYYGVPSKYRVALVK